jgi:cytochrome P450
MVFDYEGVKRALQDHQAFSSAVPAPKHWFIFMDPPRHSKMRALISRAFTPSVITRLEPRIRQLSRQLLDSALAKPEMDLAADYSIPLPMTVIAEMIGIPAKDWPRFRHWSDEMLKLSYTMRGMEQDPEAASALGAFRTVTAEMEAYLAEMIRERDENPRDDLVTRLVEAEVEGDRLSPPEILGFFQLLIVGGQETTTNLINNAILSLLENPTNWSCFEQNPSCCRARSREVLRYRVAHSMADASPKAGTWK